MDNKQPGYSSGEAGRTEKRRRFIINAVYVAIVLLIIFLVFRYAINIIMPFVLAFLVASIARPLIALLEKKARFPRALATVLVVVIFYLLLAAALTFLSARVFVLARDWVLTLPAVYRSSLQPALVSILGELEELAERFGPEFADYLGSISANLTSSIGTTITNWATGAASWAGRTVSSVPGVLVDVLICIVSSFFIAKDYDLICRFILRQFKEKTAETIVKVKRGLVSTIGSYIKGYLLIMSITFIELFIGLSLIGVGNTLVVSLAVAVFDILPVVGCGTVLIPWVVIKLIQGDYLMALGLFILWGVILIVRNIVEPKIVGQQVGLHPVLVLIGMVVGSYFFGGLGLLGLPVAFALIKKLHDDGTIGLYRSFDEPRPGSEEPDGGEKAGGESPAGESKSLLSSAKEKISSVFKSK
ncbi:MAG: sporulation integral membrane protein YtvI [Oscillospiraceae bacterium]|nr:sporulation integral membrane protein YtvI [Oscillospiraceae bacterium]